LRLLVSPARPLWVAGAAAGARPGTRRQVTPEDPGYCHGARLARDRPQLHLADKLESHGRDDVSDRPSDEAPAARSVETLAPWLPPTFACVCFRLASVRRDNLGMPVRPCLTCGRLCSATRCPECATAYNRAVNRRKDAQRPSPAERGYGHDWRKVRAEVLERDGWTCRWCGQPAKTVDHLVPLAQGGARLDTANLVAACLCCNSARGGQTRRPVFFQP
jgi:5-methylcytosine-specific restriction endonuclease McrA